MPRPAVEDHRGGPEPAPDRDYEVTMTGAGVHLHLPITGQARLRDPAHPLRPGQHLVELKSLKLYVWSYRDEGAFHEERDQPDPGRSGGGGPPALHGDRRRLNVRGGIKTEIRVTYGKPQNI